MVPPGLGRQPRRTGVAQQLMADKYFTDHGYHHLYGRYHHPKDRRNGSARRQKRPSAASNSSCDIPEQSTRPCAAGFRCRMDGEPKPFRQNPLWQAMFCQQTEPVVTDCLIPTRKVSRSCSRPSLQPHADLTATGFSPPPKWGKDLRVARQLAQQMEG